MAELIVNGFDLSALGVIVEDVPGHQDGVGRRHQSAPLPGRWGSVALARRGQAQPRRLDVQASQRATDAATLRTLRDELIWRLGAGQEIELAIPGATDRHYVARLENPGVLAIPPAFTQRMQRLKLRFTLLDPLAYTTAESSVDFLASATAIPMGTGPVLPVLTFGGPFDDLTVIARNSDASEIARMVFVITVADGDDLVVDCRDFLITNGGANAVETLQDGSDFIVFEPWHADFAASDWPTLEVSAGTPATAVATYHETWE